MTSSFNNPDRPPYPKGQATKKLRKILDSSYFNRNYKVSLSGPHLSQRLEERKLNINDVKNILETGRIHDEPEYHDNSRQWRYRVEGNIISKSGKGTVVIAFRSGTELNCLTIWPKNRR